jgi:hypothetical protein
MGSNSKGNDRTFKDFALIARQELMVEDKEVHNVQNLHEDFAQSLLRDS